MKNYLFIAIISVVLVGCSDYSHTDSPKQSVVLKAIANIKPKNKSEVNGLVTFTEMNGRVSMTAEVSGLKPGNHGIHIHVYGDCDAKDGSSAGGHWNPTKVAHGKWGNAPYHVGDLGNINADSDGNGTLSLETDLWCINCDDENKNIIGNSIIIHEAPDDYESQPTGDAGIRIACGRIIEK